MLVLGNLWLLNNAAAQGQNTLALNYVDSVELGIKKGIYKKVQAKMNCFEQWQRLYTNAEGKVVKAIGGMYESCYHTEKILYLKHDSAIYYIENYKPLTGDPNCKELPPLSYGFDTKGNKLQVQDLYNKVPVVSEDAETILSGIKGLYRAVYRDFNSKCYKSPTVEEQHIQNVNALIIAGKIKAEKLTDADDSLGTVTCYKHKGELVLLKTKFNTAKVAKSYNLYFLKGELIDYSFDHEELSDSASQILNADRFQFEMGHIKNFELLDIDNPKYSRRAEADIRKELFTFAQELRQKYQL